MPAHEPDPAMEKLARDVKRMQKWHFENKCRKCKNYGGSTYGGGCREVGPYPESVTGCIYFRKRDERWGV